MFKQGQEVVWFRPPRVPSRQAYFLRTRTPAIFNGFSKGGKRIKILVKSGNEQKEVMVDPSWVESLPRGEVVCQSS